MDCKMAGLCSSFQFQIPKQIWSPAFSHLPLHGRGGLIKEAGISSVCIAKTEKNHHKEDS